MTAKERTNEKAEILTMNDICHEWLEKTSIMVKPETQSNHEMYCKRILRGLPDGILFLDFTPAMAEQIVNSMYYKEKRSFSYSTSVLVTIKAIMKYAKKAGYIDAIYDFVDIRLKRRPVTPQELERTTNKFLNRSELAEVLKQLRAINPRVAMAMEFISLTGLRCGELLALKWEHVNWKEKQISVKGTLVKISKNGDDLQIGTPKNIYSYRDVAINERAVAILKWFQADNKRLELWTRKENVVSRTYKDRGFIFTTRTGNPYNIQFINRILRQVHIPGKKISTHIFRHTHISMLAGMGVPLKAIMSRVGHNSPRTTLSVYTHVTETMKNELRQKLETLPSMA